MEDKNSKLKGGLKKFLTNAWDLFMLNVLWIVCSLPVITMGPATCALFSVSLRIVEEEPVTAVKDFFRAFRENLKQGIVLGLIVILLGVVAFTDYRYAITFEGATKTAFLIVTGILTAIDLIIIAYAFPLQARYNNTIKAHLINSFAMAAVAPGKTISIWLIYAFPILIFVLYTEIAFNYLGWVYFMYGASLPFFWASRVLRMVFKKIVEGNESNES